MRKAFSTDAELVGRYTAATAVGHALQRLYTRTLRNKPSHVNGHVGDLRLIYTGSYLVRNISQQQDYTNYARGVYADYYQCHGAEQPRVGRHLHLAKYTWNEAERNTHQSHEVRMSTPDDWRVRGIVGGSGRNCKFRTSSIGLQDAAGLYGRSNRGLFTQVAPAVGATAVDPYTRNDNVAFFNDVTRGYRRRVFYIGRFRYFAEDLTFTAGTRYYRFVNSEVGAVTGSFGCYEAGAAPCLASAVNINAEDLHTVYRIQEPRQPHVAYLAGRTRLLHVVAGFSPGAFNRTTGCYIKDAQGIAEYCSPSAFTSDTLINNEFG